MINSQLNVCVFVHSRVASYYHTKEQNDYNTICLADRDSWAHLGANYPGTINDLVDNFLKILLYH